MEKFTVDLEKVLDEFEYNEEREENVTAPTRNIPLPNVGIGTLRQIPTARPPAASYRRPSFEPINLADADFAASPLNSTSNYNHGSSGKAFSTLSSGLQTNNKNNVCVGLNDNIVSSFSSGTEVNINKQIITDTNDTPVHIWQNSNSAYPNEEKPDLLEYNSKNSGFDTSSLDINNQLPDLTTSVRTVDHYDNNNEITNFSNSLDLISSASNACSAVNDKFNDSEVMKVEISDNLPLISSQKVDQESLHRVLPTCLEEEEKSSLVDNPEVSCFEEQSNINTLDDLEAPNAHVNCNVSESALSKPLNECSIRYVNVTEIQDNCSVLKSLQANQSKNEEKQFKNVSEYNATQTEILETPKVVSFTNDADVSDSELEEYLKELEELDEPTINEATINLTKESYVGDFETERASEHDTNQLEPTCLKISKLSFHDNQHIKKEKIVLDDNDIGSTTADASDMDNAANIILEHNLSTKKYHDTSSLNGTEDKTSLMENFINNLENNGDVDPKQLISTTLNEIKTDKVSEGNNFVNIENDHSVINKLQTEISQVSSVASTNPFDENDCGYDSDEMESQNKSKNPFEEEETKEESISELSLACGSQERVFQNVSSTLTNSVCSSKFDQEVASPSEPTVSSKVPEKRSTNISHDLNIASVSETEQTDCSNFTSIKPSVQENPAELSLPGCSSSPFGSEETSAKMIPIKTAVESPSVENIDETAVALEEEKPPRPNSLELPRKITVEASTVQSPGSGELVTELRMEDRRLGKTAPFWVPDTDTTMCMQCQSKFNVLKRRHHCRACGQVLCYKCCGLRARLEYMNFQEARVCQPCFTILEAMSESDSANPPRRQPNPNNPMEYCSTIPPLQQAAGSLHQPPPSVMVPVGVLKREGRVKSEVTKQVMFSDGIRPGGDLTELDGSGEQPRMPFRRPGRLTKRVGTPPGGVMSPTLRRVMDPSTHSFIPAEGDNSLPPVVSRLQGEVSYSDWESPINLNQAPIKFALNRNLFVVVKRVLLDCCVNRECWCFSSEGLACVGQDEVVFLLECLPQETLPPKDVFLLINSLYQDAAKGSTVSEMSFTPAQSNSLLGSRDHGGFLYIRTSFQCTDQLALPPPPYLVALLVHRWETPWARLFPIRLVLRLGAEFRYYPCPLVSVRNRTPLYTDIGHTIINILADFRKYSYTLPSVRGLVIHMEDRQTTVHIPRNRYDQVVRALNNSNDSVLAFGANFSLTADSHLVCMQNTEDENTSYHTQAINIHNKPRRVTGASFVVFNGALKTPGLTGKSSMIEDGLMVQVPGETMVALRTALRDMRDYRIDCGPNAEETVVLQWTADDTNFNIGVKSCIDGKPLDGVPSIRVHNGTDYSGGARIIRWTEVFILQCEDSEHSSEPLDISRLSESIAQATCLALVPLLDLLTAASLTSLAVRTTIHPENVGYEAGSNGEKLPPLYMKSLDDELVAVVHQAALASQDNPAVLELVFRIMEQG